LLLQFSDLETELEVVTKNAWLKVWHFLNTTKRMLSLAGQNVSRDTIYRDLTRLKMAALAAAYERDLLARDYQHFMHRACQVLSSDW
jgi:hypothetical protein